MSATITDGPIDRLSLNEMTLEQIDTHLDGIRTRRLTMVRRLQEAKAARDHSTRVALTGKFDKQADKVQRRLSKLDEEIEKCEGELNKLRSMQIELGL